jgi:hypothetical protein
MQRINAEHDNHLTKRKMIAIPAELLVLGHQCTIHQLESIISFVSLLGLHRLRSLYLFCKNLNNGH